MLRYYYRVRERYEDAVVPVNGYDCSACGMQIPANTRQEIRRGNVINYCANCGRILTWDKLK